MYLFVESFAEFIYDHSKFHLFSHSQVVAGNNLDNWINCKQDKMVNDFETNYKHYFYLKKLNMYSSCFFTLYNRTVFLLEHIDNFEERSFCQSCTKQAQNISIILFFQVPQL